MRAGLVNAAAADTLELTETNVESVLDEIRPYLMADGENHSLMHCNMSRVSVYWGWTIKFKIQAGSPVCDWTAHDSAGCGFSVHCTWPISPSLSGACPVLTLAAGCAACSQQTYASILIQSSHAKPFKADELSGMNMHQFTTPRMPLREKRDLIAPCTFCAASLSSKCRRASKILSFLSCPPYSSASRSAN